MNTRSKMKDNSSGGNLNILPVRPVEIKDKKDFHPHLPSIKHGGGSLILLIGSQNSGKTTIVNNM